MVDFRYHLVSLISVFFALAIGIILGAGPLQNSIGNVLQSQVSDLRSTNEQLKVDNAELEESMSLQEQAFDDVAPTLIGDTLTDRSVAIVVLPGVPDDDVAAVRTRLEESGATVSGRVAINETWTLASQNSFRTTFADQISAYVPSAQDDAETNQVLALALNSVVRDGVTTHDTLAGLMTGTDTPMMAIEGLTEASDAVVVLTPDVEPATGETPDPDAEVQQQYTTTTYTALVTELGTRGPTVAAGAADSEGDIVRALRDGATEVSTVDSIDLTVGRINVPIAVATELNDGLIHLGLDAGAQRVLGERTEMLAVSPRPVEGPTDSPEGDVDAPAEDQPAEEEPAEGQPADEQPAEDAPAEEQPADEPATDEVDG